MINNNGYLNELQFVDNLNGKAVKELNILYCDMITKLFTDVKSDDVIEAWKNPFLQKTDIYIVIGDVKKRISIKSGYKNSIHVESVEDFTKFLMINGVEREYIDMYLRYHYADGTLDGSGVTRVSVAEYKTVMQTEIDKLNNRLNKIQLLEKAIYRFILQGKRNVNCIDMLIYGTPDDFIYITKEEIIDLLLKKKGVYSTGVHFASMHCQPLNRCLNHNKKSEYKRHYIQVKWYNIFDDVIEYKNELLQSTVVHNLPS